MRYPGAGSKTYRAIRKARSASEMPFSPFAESISAIYVSCCGRGPPRLLPCPRHDSSGLTALSPPVPSGVTWHDAGQLRLASAIATPAAAPLCCTPKSSWRILLGVVEKIAYRPSHAVAGCSAPQPPAVLRQRNCYSDEDPRFPRSGPALWRFALPRYGRNCSIAFVEAAWRTLTNGSSS